ncbi:DNA-processing protein DprA [Flavobacterium sp. ZT3R18]|uniref:DNA-processing protein DprA n=1 Tax=Flavobacterium sp. ZT3R18 TaxID=2594429 RepID=UPI00163DC363|nr:DNA-processing protein DprA [Flavobacterium sp. ZT3R18]
MKDNSKIIGIIALSELKGIGPAFIKKVVSQNTFKSNNLIQEIKDITSSNNKPFDDDTIFDAIENAKDIIFKCKEEGITIIEFTSNDYPFLLKEIKDPPSVIYCKGNLDLLYNKTVCIIGTREPNENAVKISERIGAFYANSSWAICNGLAEGVDNFSIKSNDKIYNKVIGILAGGLNYNTKKTLLKKTAENAEKTVESGGLLISEMPPDKKEDTFTVVKSCRIQAGLSNGLILIQSSLNGGSRFTTKSFCETQRPIAVINPVNSDFDLPTYNANKEIILNSKKGLSKFTELKEDKIQISKIFVIKSKDNYTEFENLMTNRPKNIEQSNTTLFG